MTALAAESPRALQFSDARAGENDEADRWRTEHGSSGGRSRPKVTGAGPAPASSSAARGLPPSETRDPSLLASLYPAATTDVANNLSVACSSPPSSSPILLRKGIGEAELSQGAQGLRTDPEHRSSEEIQSEPLRRNAHSRGELKHHRPIARPSEVLGVKIRSAYEMPGGRSCRSAGRVRTVRRSSLQDRARPEDRKAAFAATLRPYRISAPHRSTSSREPCRHIDSDRVGRVPATPGTGARRARGSRSSRCQREENRGGQPRSGARGPGPS